MKFNLKQQGWLFVCFMLSVEVFFVGMMFKLTKEAAEDSARYQHKVDVMNKGAGLLLSTYKGGYCLAFYGMSHKASYGEAFDKFSKELPQQIKEMKDKAWPEDRAGVDNMCSIVAETLAKLNRYRVDVDESGDISLGPLRKELMPTLTGLLKELDKGVEEKQGAAEEQERRSVQNRINTLWVLAVGFAFNLGISIWFIWWFIKTVLGKLDVLSDNTIRFAAGAPLSTPLKGNDEIAHVDHIFHSMASALEEATQKERLATEILRASEERVRGIIDHMPVGLIEFNKAGQISSVNPRTEEMWCCRVTDLVGKHISQLFTGKAADDAASFMTFIEQEAIGKFAELTARRIVGASFAAEITVTELTSREQPTLLASVQDVTQRHEVERLKREFVAMVSHDLRTPLTSVHGSLTLLSAGALGDLTSDAHQVVTTAETELERLTKLVGDLLDIAKIEAGKMEVKAMPTPMQPIIARSIASISNFAERQGVSVNADKCEAQVVADSERLVQVLVNLLSNAVKFSPADSAVSITTDLVDSMLEVRVTDRGRGVPVEHQQAIFERFHQVEGADATEKKGTGLGLPICKQIIEQHGGAIGVRSQPGQGSIFWFTIPLVTSGTDSNGSGGTKDSQREMADLT